MTTNQTESKHTPTPYKGPCAPDSNQVRSKAHVHTADGEKIAVLVGKDADRNGRFIVRACNAHEELIAALKQSEIAVAELCQGQNPANECWNILKQVRAALAKAETRR